MTNLHESRLKLLLKAERESLLRELSALVTTRRPNDEKKLSAKEAASFLGISLSTLYKNVKYILHRKFGKKLVFVLKELHEFDFATIDENKRPFAEKAYRIDNPPTFIMEPSSFKVLTVYHQLHVPKSN